MEEECIDALSKILKAILPAISDMDIMGFLRVLAADDFTSLQSARFYIASNDWKSGYQVSIYFCAFCVIVTVQNIARRPPFLKIREADRGKRRRCPLLV